MSGVALQITVIVLLTVINGLFAMSETALIVRELAGEGETIERSYETYA